MRWLSGVVAGVCVGAVALGIGYSYKGRLESIQQNSKTQNAISRLRRELDVRIATKAVELNERGYPKTIDPAWFKDQEQPVNRLLSDEHPWLEIAGPEQAHLKHPEVRVALTKDTPGLWYNPYQGVIRARVPTTVSDEEALTTYNKVNEASLTSLFWKEPTPIDPATAQQQLQADQTGVSASEAFSTGKLRREHASSATNNPKRKKKSKAIVIVHRNDRTDGKDAQDDTRTVDAGE